MTTIYSERYESGGDGKSVDERRDALLRVLSNTAAQCKADHTNLFLEWGNTVEMAATDPKPNTGNSHFFRDAIPRNVFRLAVENPAKQRTGLELSVGDYVSKFYEGAMTVHTYEYMAGTLPAEGVMIGGFEVELLVFPETFFRKAASDASHHFSLKEPLVKELLVLSFMIGNGNVRGGKGGNERIRGLRHLVSKHGAPFTYQPRGWLYHSKYGEAVFNGVTYKFETAENVAAFVNIINTPAAESTNRLLATAERLADIIAAI